ncbi:MAG: phosphopyruvate hydratase [Promethearchaeota archaeon]
MSTIKEIRSRWVLDSRALPTIEADVILADGSFGRGTVPSGASTGSHEALELRDKTKDFGGKHVLKALSNIKKNIAPALIGMDALDQKAIDQRLIELDGTPNKSNLGANAILAVSMATARASAQFVNQPLYAYLAQLASRGDKYVLPLPMCNVINAGKHGSGGIAVQEFMIAPVGASSFQEGLKWVAEVYQTLKKLMKENFGENTTLLGDEGGFSGVKGKVRDALNVLVEAIEKTGYKTKNEIAFALDPAASEFYDGTTKMYKIDGQFLDSTQLSDYWVALTKEYPIFSIEDGLAEDDWAGWINFLNKAPNMQIVGDDLLVTNVERIKDALSKNACNALLLKVNQVGTLTESIEAFHLMLEKGFPTIVSHRSGETEDTFISHLAVGLGNGQIKTGAPARGERTAKYNELIRIEESLLGSSKYTFTGQNYSSVFKK